MNANPNTIQIGDAQSQSSSYNLLGYLLAKLPSSFMSPCKNKNKNKKIFKLFVCLSVPVYPPFFVNKHGMFHEREKQGFEITDFMTTKCVAMHYAQKLCFKTTAA